MPVKGRNNKEYADLAQALKRKAKRENQPCWLCGNPILWDADWRHPLSYTYDHETPLARGGKPRGTGRPAHRSCNSRRGAGDTTREPIAPPTTTKRW